MSNVEDIIEQLKANLKILQDELAYIRAEVEQILKENATLTKQLGESQREVKIWCGQHNRIIWRSEAQMDFKPVFAKITGGSQYEYLKDIELLGRVDDDGSFIVWGCRDADQPKFYQGLLDIDKACPAIGWETAEEVKEWWEEGGEGLLMYVDKGDFEIVENIERSCGR